MHLYTVDGAVSDWSGWTYCSEPCGDGTKTKRRNCNSPLPQFGGVGCTDPLTADETCNLKVKYQFLVVWQIADGL